MAVLGIKEAFAKYDASLRNVQWSVSAWTADGSLVVSLWEHHRRKSDKGTLEFAANADRWAGAGNTEFRKNLDKAFKEKSPVRLIVVRTDEVDKVESGEDASKIKKEFHPREDLVGQVIEWDGSHYAFQFKKAGV
jgi:hypothetical protein